MKRFLILAAGLVLAGTASANHPIPAPMGSGPVAGVVSGGCGGGGCGGEVAAPAGCGYARHDARFGWNPLFRKLAFWKRDNGCGTCGDSAGLFARLRSLSPFGGGLGGGCAGGGCGGAGGWGHGGPAFNPYPNGVPGTLVFPQHPFVRSPRDFFMLDAR